MNTRKVDPVKGKKLSPNFFLKINDFEDYVQTIFESLPPIDYSPKTLEENCLKGIYPNDDEIEKLSFKIEAE